MWGAIAAGARRRAAAAGVTASAAWGRKGGGGGWGAPARGGRLSASTLTGIGPLPERRPATRTVAVALSGGVDSAIAAARLLDHKKRGDEVFGVHLRTWDARDEGRGGSRHGTGETMVASSCTADADEAAARAVAASLGLDMVTLDAVAEYWCGVFAPFASAVAAGLTPNPDLACNAVLKFGSLITSVVEGMGADALATGHYARVAWGARRAQQAPPREVFEGREEDEDPWAGRPWDSSATAAASPPPALLMGRDALKDQSYFLATVPGSALRSALFPVGGLSKASVRAAAAAHPGLAAALAGRRSSAGICFVGRRRFGEFMEGYADPVPGLFRGVRAAGVRVSGGGGGGEDSERAPTWPAPSHLPFSAAPCANTWALTHGQRAPIGGTPSKLYVAGKDAASKTVWVAPGRHHPALFSEAAALGPFAWVSGEAPPAGTPLAYRARYRQQARACVLVPWAEGGHAFVPSSYTRPPEGGRAAAHMLPPPAWVARFALPARAITPAQALVLYAGPVCLGAAPVVAPGESLWEAGREAVPAAAAAAAAEEGEAGWKK